MTIVLILAILWLAAAMAFGWAVAFWLLLLLAPIAALGSLAVQHWLIEEVANLSTACRPHTGSFGPPDTLDEVRERAKRRHPSNQGKRQ